MAFFDVTGGYTPGTLQVGTLETNNFAAVHIDTTEIDCTGNISAGGDVNCTDVGCNDMRSLNVYTKNITLNTGGTGVRPVKTCTSAGNGLAANNVSIQDIDNGIVICSGNVSVTLVCTSTAAAIILQLGFTQNGDTAYLNICGDSANGQAGGFVCNFIGAGITVVGNAGPWAFDSPSMRQYMVTVTSIAANLIVIYC